MMTDTAFSAEVGKTKGLATSGSVSLVPIFNGPLSSPDESVTRNPSISRTPSLTAPLNSSPTVGTSKAIGSYSMVREHGEIGKSEARSVTPLPISPISPCSRYNQSDLNEHELAKVGGTDARLIQVGLRFTVHCPRQH